MEKKELYRQIPKMDALLADPVMQQLITKYDRESFVSVAREQLESIRAGIMGGMSAEQFRHAIDGLDVSIEVGLKQRYEMDLRPVINATGTILHTNLGRAPLSPAQMKQICQVAGGYSNLEYDLDTGARGERYSHFEQLLCQITGAEAAMAVNNNAASVLLILSTLAKGGEAIVSRGELIEIGGKFRIPDVMEQSGATLVEVGTTNKTHFDDYLSAITEETKVILKVHTSNYQILGFTESVGIRQLSELGREKKIPVIEDLGSGALVDLAKYGISAEPVVQNSVRDGADVVCFSGDKLLGGPQAGIIVGKKAYIDRMKKNPLTRAVRIDKFTAAALEVVLKEYLSQERAVANIPVLRMITESRADLQMRAELLEKILCDAKKTKEPSLLSDAEITICDCQSMIGGGSLPMERLDSAAVRIWPKSGSATELEERLRHLPVPVVTRIAEDAILMDVRTMTEDDIRIFETQLGDL